MESFPNQNETQKVDFETLRLEKLNSSPTIRAGCSGNPSTRLKVVEIVIETLIGNQSIDNHFVEQHGDSLEFSKLQNFS